LQPWLEEEIKSFWAQHGEGPSSAMRRVAEEWWTLENCPALEFRDDVSGRRAALRGGPDVWEVAQLNQSYENDEERLHDHFGGLVARDALRQALEYAERFPEQIQMQLAQNERLRALLERTR
jgi:hypothetical protein